MIVRRPRCLWENASPRTCTVANESDADRTQFITVLLQPYIASRIRQVPPRSPAWSPAFRQPEGVVPARVIKRPNLESSHERCARRAYTRKSVGDLLIHWSCPGNDFCVNPRRIPTLESSPRGWQPSGFIRTQNRLDRDGNERRADHEEADTHHVGGRSRAGDPEQRRRGCQPGRGVLCPRASFRDCLVNAALHATDIDGGGRIH